MLADRVHFSIKKEYPNWKSLKLDGEEKEGGLKQGHQRGELKARGGGHIVQVLVLMYV